MPVGKESVKTTVLSVIVAEIVGTVLGWLSSRYILGNQDFLFSASHLAVAVIALGFVPLVGKLLGGFGKTTESSPASSHSSD